MSRVETWEVVLRCIADPLDFADQHGWDNSCCFILFISREKAKQPDPLNGELIPDCEGKKRTASHTHGNRTVQFDEHGQFMSRLHFCRAMSVPFGTRNAT